MKKILFCAAAVAMLGLASCSSKSENAADTASVDSANDSAILVEQVTEVSEDTNAQGDTLVQVAQQTTVAEVAPADSAK
ncbi:MAG: hypothetical protein K2M56_03105 [Muribaculaceae bacterium]|nr:hypothetical protein [Muribaculaceae bacterium]